MGKSIYIITSKKKKKSIYIMCSILKSSYIMEKTISIEELHVQPKPKRVEIYKRSSSR